MCPENCAWWIDSRDSCTANGESHKHYVDKTQLKSAGLPFKPTSALLPVLLQHAPHQPVGRPRENSKIRRISTLHVSFRQEYEVTFGDSGVSILGMCTSLFSAVRCVCLDAHQRYLHAARVIASVDATGLTWSRPGRGSVQTQGVADILSLIHI